jgi:hypothetical protein
VRFRDKGSKVYQGNGDVGVLSSLKPMVGWRLGAIGFIDSQEWGVGY